VSSSNEPGYEKIRPRRALWLWKPLGEGSGAGISFTPSVVDRGSSIFLHYINAAQFFISCHLHQHCAIT
jgi:hypothetical protein